MVPEAVLLELELLVVPGLLLDADELELEPEPQAATPTDAATAKATALMRLTLTSSPSFSRFGGVSSAPGCRL